MGFKELKDLLREQDSVDWREVDDGIVCDYRDGGDYALLRQAPENPRAWMLGVDERKFHEEIAKHGSADWFMSSMKEQRLAAAIAWSRCRP